MHTYTHKHTHKYTRPHTFRCLVLWPTTAPNTHTHTHTHRYAHIRTQTTTHVHTPTCLQVPGVEAYYGAKDIPGSNWIGPVVQDEEVFASEFVTCVGQVCVCVIGVRRMARSVAALPLSLSPVWGRCVCVIGVRRMARSVAALPLSLSPV